MKTGQVKGFKDFLGEEASRRKNMISIIEEQFEKYGFEKAETPVIENKDFVVGENLNDEAVRDVFKLTDRGKRKLALRYEFTFQLKRIADRQKLPFKRYEIGYVFRDEPIKKGRLRQFIQCDADIIGSSLKDEAELLAMIMKIYKKLGIKVKIFVNNRKLINEILSEEKVKEEDVSQVIREIDKLDKIPLNEIARNLSEYKAEKVLDIFGKKEKFFEKYQAYKEIKELKKISKLFGVEFEFKPTLARGLSYYNGTVFEVWSEKLGVSLGGGGSYLVNNTQATGFSFGLEPISLLAKTKPTNIDYLIISLGQDAPTINLAEKLRKKFTVQTLFDKSVGKAMEYANAKNISKVIVVGEKEADSGKFKVKEMESGEETNL